MGGSTGPYNAPPTVVMDRREETRLVMVRAIASYHAGKVLQGVDVSMRGLSVNEMADEVLAALIKEGLLT